MTRFALIASLFAACGTAALAQERDLKQFTWLAGVWELTDGSRHVEEHWTEPSSNMMVGMSRTVAAGRTSAFEFLRIEKRGADFFYVPQPNGRPPVAFKLTSDADGRFVFENTSGEDRVSRIEYRRVGENALEARVQGAENGKPFVLEYRYTRRN